MEPLSVGEVAARLGVATSTVRMWGERYGLTASASSQGGHRRYTEEDVDRLQGMYEAVITGTSPAAAAAQALGHCAEALKSGPGGPGGAVLSVPGATKEVKGIARAASRLDEMGVEDAVVESLRVRGTLESWDMVIRPVLVSAGQYWQRTGSGVEIEHLLSQAVTTALIRHVVSMTAPDRDRPILLAGGPTEEHVLPLHAVRAGLAERGVPARILGPRTPMSALTSAARRTRAAGVLVWMSLPDPIAAEGITPLLAAHRRMVLLLGGVGWDGVPVGPATPCSSLREAVTILEQAWLTPSGRTARSAAPTS
jgi:excisionase family DNA binding protein